MALNMRSKQYPALPPARERRLSLVLPRTGDLRYRSLLPAAFRRQLFVHVDDARRDWYARFSLERRFIVMSSEGDLYTNTVCMALTGKDLRLLAMPNVAPGDLLRALDLVACRALPTGHPQWEIVLMRWRNGMETWLPLDVVHATHPHLLQAFYVNSINSWALRNRILPASLGAHQTEVELWLYHKEFQAFYQALRRRRALQAQPQYHHQQQQQQHRHASGSTVDVKPVLSGNESAGRTSTQQTSTAYRIPSSTSAPVQQAQLPQQAHPSSAYRATGIVANPDAPQVVNRIPQPASSGYHPVQQQRQGALEPDRLLYHQLQQQRHLQQQYLQQLRQHQQYQQNLQHISDQQQYRVLTPHTPQPMLMQHPSLRHATPASQAQAAGYVQQRAPEQHPPPAAGVSQLPIAQRQPPVQASQPQPIRQYQPEPSPEPVPARVNQQNSSTQRAQSTQASEHQSSVDARTGFGLARASEDGTTRSDTVADSSTQNQDRSRIRKRLARSHVDDDDENDDDLPDLSRWPGSSSTSKTTEAVEETSKTTEAVDKTISSSGSNDSCGQENGRRSAEVRKSRKRLRQSHANSPSGGNDVDVTILDIDGSDKESGGSRTQYRHHHKPSLSNSSKHRSPRPAQSYDDDERVDVGGALAIPGAVKLEARHPGSVAAAGIVGEIRCACGATSVNEYRGRWLQCTNTDCGLWQHADCVGALTTGDDDELEIDKYECSKCDRRGYTLRRAQARTRMVEWMFQCCESFNSVQLLALINDALLARKKRVREWRHRKQNRMTLLMKAARHGLADCVAKLLEKSVIDAVGSVQATDTLDQNALHHAAIGESASCCQLLLKHTRKQLHQASLNGVTPFHLMLRSLKLNHFCISLLREDGSLSRKCDFKSNYPIHYACSAVNKSTAELCRLILDLQPSMLHEKSSEGLYPPMILCRSTPRSGDSGDLTPSAAAECLKKSLDIMLDVDVFGLCLDKKTVRGWTVAHFAAAAGNHEVIVHLGNTGDVDLNAASHEGLTPLHIAAMKNHTACVRRLLEFGANIMAKDSTGVIPMLFATDVACIQEFMHYKLTKHISRLHRMLPRRQHQGLVRQWQRRVVLNPTCFDMLNDWCSCDPGRIERMDGIFLSNRYMLRLDNKLEFIRKYMIPCLVQSEDSSTPTKKLRFTFASAANTSFWRQFVDIATQLQPSDFRSHFVFAMVTSRGITLTYEGKGVKLVLIRLAADLLRQEQGVLLRGNHEDDAAASSASIHSLGKASQDEIRARLVDFYVLGELMAHLALFSIPTSTIFNFSPWFLDGVFSDDEVGLHHHGNGETSREESYWATLGRSFRLGFQAVLPSALSLLHPDEFRVLQNSSSEITLNACAIDWSSAVEWVVEESDDADDTDKSDQPEELGVGERGNVTAKWFARLSTELVAEEQQLLLLFMTQTLPAANALFFLPLEGENDQRVDGNNTRKRIRIVVGDKELDPAVDDGAKKEGGKLPFMCHKTRTLHLLRYPSYKCFKTSILRTVRRLKRAFMSVYD